MTTADSSLADLEPSPFDMDEDERFAAAANPKPAPRHDREPVSFAHAMSSPIPHAEIHDFGGSSVTEALQNFGGNGTFDHPVFGFGVDDPAKEPHPFNGLCKSCLCAAPPRETKLPQPWSNMDTKAEDGRWLFRGYLAVNCCDACYENAKTDQSRLKHNREMWEKICPTEFRKDWDADKGNNALFKQVMEWAKLWDTDQLRSPEKGLVIHGDTDSAKTRVCWQLYRQLAEQGVGVMFIESFDLLHEMPNEAFNVGVLIIDDLGNDTMDYRSEQRLLKLLRSRAQWHRPFVITTQFGGEKLIARFKQDATGAAVVRRLRSFCTSIHARKPGEGGITRDEHGKAVMS